MVVFGQTAGAQPTAKVKIVNCFSSFFLKQFLYCLLQSAKALKYIPYEEKRLESFRVIFKRIKATEKVLIEQRYL